MLKNKMENKMINKSLDSIKYVRDNFWKVLPGGSYVNYERKMGKLSEEGYKSKWHVLEDIPGLGEVDLKAFFHKTYAIAGCIVGPVLLVARMLDK